jgi:hypothetical protein
MLDLRKQADVHDPASLSNSMRNRRFRIFEHLFDRFPKPVRLIDVGGTLDFWTNRGWVGRDDVAITAVNIGGEEQTVDNITVVRGDATNMHQFADRSFDIAFSNSVIEHLFTLENQVKMASEVARVARAHWVQTPNFWFPIEPHFHFIGWQWLPRAARVALLRRRRCGWRGPCPDPEKARAFVEEVRLMTRGELRRAFPGSEIWREKYRGLTKSFVVYAGFGTTIDDRTLGHASHHPPAASA